MAGALSCRPHSPGPQEDGGGPDANASRMAFTVVVIDHDFPSLEPEERVLRPMGVRLDVLKSRDRATLRSALERADAVINQYVELDADLIGAMTRCLLIAHYGVGYDSIDVAAATRAGICVANVPDYGTQEVAIHAISLLLVEKAREGKMVVRLKWGDPFVFDSGGKEALFLHEQQIPFEVVPGVTAALAAGVRPILTVSAQEQPHVGTWDLNLAKSTFNPGPPPLRQALTFQAAGPHWTAFVQGIDAAGHPIKSELANLVISFDGRDHPTPNEDYETSAWKRIDSHKYQVVRKRAGKPVLTIVNEVSTDGQTMTITTTGTNAAGQPVHIVAVYDKR